MDNPFFSPTEYFAREEHSPLLPVLTKPFYTVQEVAERYATSTKTIYRRIEAGLLKKHLGMRHIRIPRESLEYYEKHWLNH